jgi:poly(A) polymerase
VRKGWERGEAAGEPSFQALQYAVDEVFDARIGDVSGRGKLGADMRDIWLMQPRFDKRLGRSPYSLADQPRFRAGFDFLRLRAQVGEAEEELAHWWETFSTANDAQRDDMVDTVRQEALQKPAAAKRRRPRRKKPSNGSASGAGAAAD